ncbi:uncharacterized protein LOC132272526 [Cornus florida]|uniref:uncharacterized protein LOC132272526 n=1 Tax=Cornus florida TaxID=4283 RepID=UPI00289C2B0B|nr:uncharacterized protein LOC132272526 [Cornus florida]
MFDVVLLQEDAQAMLFQVKHKVSRCCVFITAVYAANRAVDRSLLWGILKVHEAKVTGPWITLGDWNMVRANYEKKGGKHVSQSLLDEFNGAIYDIKMEDLPTNNGDWSWCNKQGVQTRINAKLDRVLVNSAWLHSFTDSKVYLTAASLSDHYGMDVHQNFVSSLGPKPFKFLKIWCMQDEVKEVVATSWNIGVFGSPLHVLQKKLRERRCHNAIIALENTKGEKSNDPKVIKEWLVEYYTDLYNDVGGVNEEILEPRKRLTQTEGIGLEHVISVKEIKAVVMQFSPDKAPGPDGFPARFFQKYWGIVGPEVVNGVAYFFSTSMLPKGVNSTFLTLICKSNHGDKISNYRPIALCNIIYKIISKILANRLSSVLPNLIGPEQSAFIKGRRLHDNFWLISDLVKNFGRKNGDPTVALKIDLKKAYDSVDWGFLQKVLLSFGFSEKWISWVMECTSIANFSILCNGVPTGFFSASKGLRQGCPLSPLLFAFVTEYFSNLIVKAIEEGKIKRCKAVLKTGLSISHAFYTDDLVMVVKADVSTLKGVEEVLQRFKISAGLQEVKNMLERKFKKFLWSGKQEIRKMSQLKWSKVTLPAMEGGFNIRRIIDIDCATKMNMCWDFIQKKDKLWIQWLQAIYLNKIVFWLVVPKVTDSDVWKHILGVRDLILDKVLFQVGDGNHFKLLTDPWCNDHYLIQLFGAVRFRGLDRQTELASSIDHGVWSLTKNLEFTQNVIQQVIIHEGSDQIKWKDGQFTLKAAWNSCRSSTQIVKWAVSLIEWLRLGEADVLLLSLGFLA